MHFDFIEGRDLTGIFASAFTIGNAINISQIAVNWELEGGEEQRRITIFRAMALRKLLKLCPDGRQHWVLN